MKTFRYILNVLTIITFFVGCSDKEPTKEPAKEEVITPLQETTTVTTPMISFAPGTLPTAAKRDFDATLASVSAEIAATSMEADNYDRAVKMMMGIEVELDGTPEEKAEQLSKAMKKDPRYDGMEIVVKGAEVTAKANVPDAADTDESAQSRLENWLDGRDYETIPLIEIAAQLWYLPDTQKGKMIYTYYNHMTYHIFQTFSIKDKPE